LQELANDLEVDPEAIMMWFQLQFSTSIKQNDLYGSFPASKLQECLQDFVETHILCRICDIPELYMEVNTKGTILERTCKSCEYNEAFPVETNKMIKYFAKKLVSRSNLSQTKKK
jgi:translation initiation factor 2 beta subunit (eIF-2beta)/eIF-5